MDEYISNIIREYNEHADAYEAVKCQAGKMFEESFHAFMCNAIAISVARSTRRELKDRFAAEAHCS